MPPARDATANSVRKWKTETLNLAIPVPLSHLYAFEHRAIELAQHFQDKSAKTLQESLHGVPLWKKEKGGTSSTFLRIRDRLLNPLPTWVKEARCINTRLTTGELVSFATLLETRPSACSSSQ